MAAADRDSASGTRKGRSGRSKRLPFGGKRRLYNVVEIRLPTGLTRHDYDAQMLALSPGDTVVVDTSKGPSLASVVSEVHRKVVATGTLKRVLRIATGEDERRAASNKKREDEAHRFALQRVRARKLPMKLIRVQYMHDGSKAIFFFSADGRIDFRDLVKDLAGRFRTRIEMRQIGVRDGAKMVGGIGSCGRELCCSTFLSSFAPVSIRMAKDQGLTLNPKKVSGMCGRLMCCLVYEQHVYRRAKKRLPRVGRAVMTAMGPGSIRNVDIVAERVRVRLDDGPEEEFAANDVVLLDGRGRKRGPRRDRPRQPEAEQASGPVNPDDQLKQALKEAVDGDETYLWDDGDNKAGQSEREAKPKRSGRRRRGRRRGRGDKRTASSEGGRAQKDGKSSGGQRKGQSQKEGGRTGRSRGKGSARADGTRASTTEDKPQGNKRRRRRRRRSGGNRSGGGEGGKGKDG